MEKKSTVVKSKSSNSAIVTRLSGRHKMSSSNYDMEMNSRSRGAHVDKSPKREPVPNKPPKRPRPGKKKFLTSVLTILSKSTAGTQYPEKDNSDRVNDGTKPRSRQKTDADERNRRTKCKSRVLDERNDDVIVLISNKEMSQTSTSSKTENLKWSSVGQSDKSNRNSIKFQLDGDEDSAGHVARMEEAKNIWSKHGEQTTLASDIQKADDKKIYKFFVDLLQTTFDIYKVDDLERETNESRTHLEVNESVVKKLMIKDESQLDEEKYCSKLCSNTSDKERERKESFLSSFAEKPLEILDFTPKARTKVKKSLNTRKEKPTKSKSFDVPKKSQKPNKELLHILKEELTKDAFIYEEPKNLYQALKVMAKNKKKTQKSIRFNEKQFLSFDGKECMLRRKVLFKTKKKNRKPDRNAPSRLASKSLDTKYAILDPSQHSLEVYGYDYEERGRGERWDAWRERPVEGRYTPFAIRSPSSVSDSDVFCSSYELPVDSDTRSSFMS